MPPVSPENAALQHAIAEATAHLRAQLRQDLAALRQAVNQSEQLVQDVQRERASCLRSRVIGTAAASLPPASPAVSD
jgi:hypothetical protein